MDTKQIIKFGEQVKVKEDLRNPQEFFKTREGLWVSDDFKEQIVAKASPSAVDMLIVSGDLLVRSTDEEIESALPTTHVFSEEQVCLVLASLIEKQSKGEAGFLLNNGYSNLFYTPDRVVIVCWCDGEWDVGTWGRGGGVWGADRRVFSPATDAVISPSPKPLDSVALGTRESEPALTLGGKRVRVTFNPGQNENVQRIKAETANLIDLLETLPVDSGPSEKRRLISLAQTAYEEAAMWAVKAATS